MAIHLDHTIIPAHDKEASAKFFAQVFGLQYKGLWAHFAPVKVNNTLSLDFDNREKFEPHHYAFLVSEEEFDAIFRQVQEAGIPYGSGPNAQGNMQINHHYGGRGFYFRDPNGHSLEVITRTYGETPEG